MLRWPVKVPVRTSFGTMHDRPAVLVRVEDAEGAHGWGEAWCNFPSCGAEHRARLIESVLAPLLVGRAFASPEAAFAEMTARTAVLAIQSGEPGPIAQAIAGVDIALHDLAARRRGLPLWRHLSRAAGEGGGTAGVPVYASGINPERPGDTVAALRAAGYTAFKLKVGFGAERDVANLAEVRAAAGAGAAVMVDANQAWDLATATAMADALARVGAGLARGAAARRPAAGRVAAPRRRVADSARRRRERDRRGGLRRARRRPRRRRGPARSRQVGRHLGRGRGRRPHRRGRPALLPALPRRRHRPARLGAPARRPRRRPTAGSRSMPTRTRCARLLCPPLATLANGRIALPEAPGLGCEPDLAGLRALCA